MKYLTPAQYKRFGEGIDLTDVSDMTLAYVISRAEAGVDAHMGFDTKKGGFEPHNIMIQRPFRQDGRRTYFPTYEVPVRAINRYRIQVSNISTSGAGFFATINPGDCVINNDDSYVEIVPLNALTYSLSPILIQLGLKEPIVEMDCEVGYYIAKFGQSLINGGQNTVYYALDGFWATTYDQALAIQPNQMPPIPPVVYKNGVIVTSGYTFDPIDGSVTFAEPNLPTDSITCDYTQTIPDNVTEACILQTSYLLAQRALNEMKMYRGLFQMRTGEQMLSYPRFYAVSEQGRAVASGLCPEAAATLARMQDWGIA